MIRENVPSLRIREQDGSPNVIPVYILEVSNGTLTDMGGGKVRLATGAGGGGSGFTVPLIVDSGGTGDTTLTNRGILIGSGTNPIQVLAALNSGELIVGSSTVTAPQILGAGSQGQVLISDSSTRLGMAWTNTASIPGASGVTYAQTENTYIVIGLNTNLTAERNLAAGRGLAIADSGANAAVTLYIPTPLDITSGGTGVGTAFSDGSIIFTSGATGSYTTNTALLAWHSSFNQLMIGRRTTGATVTISRGYPGGTQVDWNVIHGIRPVLILEQNSSQRNQLSFYTGTGQISSIKFDDQRSTTFSDAAGFIQYDHSIDDFTWGVSGGNSTFQARKSQTSIGDPPVLVSGVMLNVVGSSRTTSVHILGAQATSAGHAVRADRLISTVYPISGGGNLSLDRTFAVDTSFLVNSGRTISAGSGLTGGGDLSADRNFSVNTNIRDKVVGFFLPGNLSTTMLGEEQRIYIPFNMEPLRVNLGCTTSPTGQALIVQLNQYNSQLGAGTGIFLAANRPQIADGGVAGSSLTFDFPALFAGSYLGVQIDQVGSTVSGSNLTVNFVIRTS